MIYKSYEKTFPPGSFSNTFRLIILRHLEEIRNLIELRNRIKLIFNKNVNLKKRLRNFLERPRYSGGKETTTTW